MKLYRISRRTYAHDLSGRGAELHGGRWNPPGVKVVYTSSAASLAILESLAWSSLNQLLHAGFVLTQIRCPDDSIHEISIAELTAQWQAPESYSALQNIGMEWLSGQNSLLLKVPSAIIPLEFNFLINPNHDRMREVVIEEMYALTLDQRVVRNMQE